VSISLVSNQKSQPSHNENGGFDELTGEPKDFTGIPPTLASKSPDDAIYEPDFNTDRFGK
ncbi:unnamed protein product, partial [Rotaria socialis]